VSATQNAVRPTTTSPTPAGNAQRAGIWPPAISRALVDAATAGIGKKTAEEIAAELKPKFPVFTKEQLLTDMEHGGPPWSRAVINVKGGVPRVAEALTASLYRFLNSTCTPP
jgi:hypothetical protein